ncbi:lysosomal-associated transmembrane protein 4A-like [Patiria miniata]|uniref:Lysosomal-associated transmembrane protein 4A n=1 Tax=Patiria miniata TaxID=46514 RepID=A0A914A1G2_PATMI|nr:lysosomal-associated transmembrane protein 4A-like [Patiria miniata]
MGRDSQSHPSCCFCLHVRTGSILIALWHMVGQVCAMLLIASMIIKGSDEGNTDKDGGSIFSIENQHDASDYCVGLVIVFCYFLITSMMIKGVAQYQSSYLLPFFCLQLFDFFITCLTAIGLMSYYPDYDYEDTGKFPYNQEFMHWKERFPVNKFDIDNQWFMLIALVLFLFIMMVKAYCIACVWSCYKYIAAREIGDNVSSNNYAMDAEALLPKLPNYDDAIKTPSEKPPPYEE